MLEEIWRLLLKVFPNGIEKIKEQEIEYHFYIKSKRGKIFELYRNEENVIENAEREIFFEMAESQIRVTVAEFAVGKVFLHAGVVGWKGRAIVIPAQSFSGKTTLSPNWLKKEPCIIPMNTLFWIVEVMRSRFRNGFRCAELLMLTRSWIVRSNLSAVLPERKRFRSGWF